MALSVINEKKRSTWFSQELLVGMEVHVPARPTRQPRLDFRVVNSACRASVLGLPTAPVDQLALVIKRRSTIEPAIGHMKMDGRLGRNPLCTCSCPAPGTTLRLILATLRPYCAHFGLSMQVVIAALVAPSSNHRLARGWESDCSGRTNYVYVCQIRPHNSRAATNTGSICCSLNR